MIDHLTIGQMKEIARRLEWTPEEKRNGQLWLKKAREVKAEYGLTDEEILRPKLSWDAIRKLL